MPSLSASTLGHLLGDWRDTGSALRALAERIRLLLLDGRITSGTRLPAERELAAVLALSRTTVAAAYAHLRETGYVTSVRGSGSVIALPAVTPPGDARPAHVEIDLTRAALPAATTVLDLSRQAVEDLPRYLSGVGYDLVGLPELRTQLALRYTARGLATRPDEVLVTLGAQHAVGLLARALTSPGDRVLVESPGYPHALDAVRAVGGRPVAVPVAPTTATSPGGWDQESLEEAFARTRPALGYLMPGFHNPTGSVMPAAQRRRVCELARRYGTRLVVDETTNDLAIDGEVPPPFPSDVIHVGSAAKTLWGGLRIGWIRADAATVRRLAERRSPWELGTPVLDQLVVARALPDLDAVLAARGVELRARRDALLSEVGDRLPEWELPVVPGGLALWVHLGRALSSPLAVAARRYGVHVTAGPRFGVDGAFERYLRLPFGADPETLREAVARLAHAWNDVRATAPSPSPFAVLV
ncbi:PLP-dependent aminotransferase family protein [Kineococcus sp. NBC_00420]|uniref:MocR-like transcription factor YczR n=1 Tax=Kineococcus sp. NBC_00420 TaxID=2903564 RepID=UPI002E1A982D